MTVGNLVFRMHRALSSPWRVGAPSFLPSFGRWVSTAHNFAVGIDTTFSSEVISGCYLRHDDGKKVWDVYRVEEGTRLIRDDYPTSRSDDATLRLGWDARNAKCKGK